MPNLKDQEKSEKEYGLEKTNDYVDRTHPLVPGAAASTGGKTKKGSSPSVTVDFSNEPKAKKSKTDTEVCTCPVCYEVVPRSSMAEHLESCNGMQNIFDFDFDLIEDIEDSDSEDIEPKKTGQNCPICSSCIEGDLKSHVDNCLNNSGIVNILDDLTDLNESKCSQANAKSSVKEFKHCVLCGLDVIGSFEDHVENCFDKSFHNHDFKISDCELPKKSCDMQTKVSNAVLDDSFYSTSENVSNNNICPVCNKRFDINLEAHINNCLNDSMSSSDFDEPIETESVTPKKIDDCLTQVPKGSKRNYVTGSRKSDDNINLTTVSKENSEIGFEDFDSLSLKYLIRSEDSIGLDVFDSGPYKKVFDNQNRVSKNVGFEKNSYFLDLTDCRKSCPVCAKFIEGDMSFHLDICLNKSCSVNDFNDPIIVISDSESPVKVGNDSKIPLPKMLDMNNLESERRVACRICGMKFGVSKFSGHVCYEC